MPSRGSRDQLARRVQPARLDPLGQREPPVLRARKEFKVTLGQLAQRELKAMSAQPGRLVQPVLPGQLDRKAIRELSVRRVQLGQPGR